MSTLAVRANLSATAALAIQPAAYSAPASGQSAPGSSLHILKARNVKRVMGCELRRQLRDPAGGVWLSRCDCEVGCGCGVVASMVTRVWSCWLSFLVARRSAWFERVEVVSV
jgi:hypothetical protein